MGIVSAKHQKRVEGIKNEESPTSDSPKKLKKKGSLLSFRSKKKKDSTPGFSKKKLEELFEHYKKVKEEEEIEEDVMGPNGVSKLLCDVGLSPDDILSFMIGWSFGCQEIGYITKEEFVGGMTKLKIDSIEKLKENISTFKQDFEENKDKVWKWTFETSQERKVLELDMALVLIDLFFPKHENHPHAQEFIEFLKEQEDTKNLSKDQWNTLYEFIHSVDHELTNYDAEDAWPCLFDDYVEWRKKRNQVPEGAGTKSRESYGLENKPMLGWGTDQGRIDYSKWY